MAASPRGRTTSRTSRASAIRGPVAWLGAGVREADPPPSGRHPSHSDTSRSRMKVKKRLLLVFAFALIFVGATIIPVNGAISFPDLTEEGPLEVGDRVRILVAEHQGRSGAITEIIDDSSGTMYVIDGLPHTYPPSDTFYANDLERLELQLEFQGIRDLIGFFQQLTPTPEEGSN